MACKYSDDAPPTPEKKSEDFKPRAYQLELYEHAKKQNSILVLGTGSGKTFISILLLKHLGHQIRKSLKKNRKWTVFVVNTVPLVYQQGRAIQHHTAFSVGLFESSRGVDLWSDGKWIEELDQHEVLVMTAQIFLDRLLHHHRQLLPLSLASVNLLIVDECHHATGNHPMREIMRRYNDLQDYKPELCPRVMGLTACVIQKKCKLREVTKSIRELEKTMFSALVTSADAIAVKKHSTAAKEIVICFETEKLSEYAESIQAQLIGTTSEVHDMHDIDDKQKKLLIKKLQNINEIIVHLGEWCGARAVKYEMENFEETEELEEIPALRYLKKRIIQRLELIYQYCCQNEKNMSDPLRHASKKVQRLCEILSVSKNDACGLIFVYRRNTAKLLYELLLQAAKIHDKLSFIRPAYVIGHNSRIGLDINLIQNELKNQNETLAAFARGETNILVSTSVLEEGLDIRHCNMVIRFDKPMNYRAHVQSRGRARAIPAKYILMIEENSVDEMLSTLELYTEIEAVLTDICHNRELPTDVETAVHFAEDEHIPPYQPYGPYGATVTFNSAVSLISVYCGKLPHDKFTDLIPEICYQQSETGDPKVKAGIRLPINSCLKSTVYGDWMENKDHAKKSAALVLCKKLHQMKELNDYLRPTSKSDITIFDDMVEEVEPSEMSTESDMPQLGTKKHRNVYNKEMCPAFSVMNNDFKLYSVIVQSKGIGNDEIIIDSGRKNISVGLLCKETLNLPPFSLYSSKWDEVMIRIKLIDESLQLDSRTVNHIEHFHKIVFENLLDTSPTLFDFRPQETSLLIVPMRGDQIDTSLLSNSASWKSLRMLDALTASDDIFNFERSLYEDAIIYPLYFPLSEPMYYVTNILDHVGPKDKFPEGGKSYKTFEEYFLFKYERKISNMDQPLMTAKHVPKGKDLNNLQRTVQRTSGKRKNQILGNFVPELCGVLPLRATLWWQIMLIPSVLNRLNYLSMAEELTMMMTSTPSHATPKWQSNETDSLDFDWSSKFIKKIVQPTGNNLSVILSNTEPRPIQPFMIVNALTLKGANDNFDLERLEVLGDAFLKYAVTEYLFLRFPADHEGKLTMKRSKFVSNKNLYLFGMKKQLPGKIHSIKLNPPMNGILPGFVLKHEVEQKLRELNAPYELWPRFADFTEEEFKEEIKKSEGICKTSCYNPWTQHELADKSVADCVEAIIGVGLLVGGRETAIQVLCNFGIGVTNGSSLKTHIPIQSAMLNKEQWAIEEMQKYYQKCCLNVLEEKIQYKFKDRSFIVQAVTHSSFCQNKVTDCYQRLEYLGDAILDYLVTGMVFSGHDYTPGQISDMRSYYVSNETLAKAAVMHNLQGHLLYLAPKLQSSIEKYINLFENGFNQEEELVTEDDAMDCQEVEVPKVLGDLVEAIIAAVYLDSGKSLQEAWNVVQILMGDIMGDKLTDIKISCVRKLFEKVPSAKFIKSGTDEEDGKATYELKIPGLPPLARSAKNYKVAKIAVAKAALRMLKEKENNVDRLNRWK